jgi:hypothetical protein
MTWLAVPPPTGWGLESARAVGLSVKGRVRRDDCNAFGASAIVRVLGSGGLFYLDSGVLARAFGRLESGLETREVVFT